jgi:hypothetical protein
MCRHRSWVIQYQKYIITSEISKYLVGIAYPNEPPTTLAFEYRSVLHGQQGQSQA